MGSINISAAGDLNINKGVSISGDGMAISIDGNVGLTFDRKSRIIRITGLDERDRVIHHTSTAETYEQSVTIELRSR